MTIPELLTAMAILSFVLTGIFTVFVGGLNATTDMNERFQAQQAARLALTSMRNDIRSACTAAVSPPTGPTAGSVVALTEPGGTPASCSTSTQVTWCADSATGNAPFTLYRQTSNTCAYNNGTSRATSLKTNANVFGCSTSANARPQIAVSLLVDANLANAKDLYTLTDSIAMRNAPVGAPCT
jgi:Tfp pilus assembly protein PilW